VTLALMRKMIKTGGMDGFIDVCMANEPRPTNGRPDNRLNTSIIHVIHQANINNIPLNDGAITNRDFKLTHYQ
jgi:hypothetical protein